MKKIAFSTIVAAAMISMSAIGVAHAFTIPGMGNSSNAAPAADLTGQQTALISTYNKANQQVFGANVTLSQALGLKNQAEALKASAKSLTEGSTQDSLASSSVAISENTTAITEKLKENPQLDKASKALYAKGLASLVGGVKQYLGMTKNVSDMSSGLSANPMAVAKLQPAVTVVKDFPKSMTQLKDTLTAAISFAKTNNIPVPADATSVLE